MRQITSDFAQCVSTKRSIERSIQPASAPYPTLSLCSAFAMPSAPAMKVVRAFENFDLNIEPSHATTP